MHLPKCKGCGYQRTSADSAPALECPACRMPYAWSETPLPAGYAAPEEKPLPLSKAALSEPRARSRQQADVSAPRKVGRYVNDTLSGGEKVVHVASLHWIIYLPGAVLLAIGMLSVAARTSADMVLAGGDLLAWLGGFLLVRAFLLQYSTEMAITTKRVVGKTGFIRRQTLDLNHSRVESYSVNQSVLGRLLNYGTVTVRGTGSGVTVFRSVVDPLTYRRKAAELADNVQQG